MIDVTGLRVTDWRSIGDALGDAADAIGTKWYWRGHGIENWAVRPHVFRPDAPGGTPFNESTLIGHFRAGAPSRYRDLPGDSNYFEWLLLAQHYGLPTRLLDWSESILVALFFACELHPLVDGCLWALQPGYMNNSLVGGGRFLYGPDLPQTSEIVHGAFEKTTKVLKKAVAVGAHQVDPRMLAQHAAFTVHSDGDDLTILSGNEPWLRKYIIPATAKSNLMNLLITLGVNRMTLFPDLQNLATFIREIPFHSGQVV